MTIGDIGWLAGIIDGEGCISVTKKRTYKNTTIGYYVLSVSVANTDEAMINKLVDMFNGCVFLKKRNGKRKDFWRWELSGKSA
jgi:hypothetical protein